MPKRLIEAGGGEPLLNIASYGRRGPGRRDRLSPDEIELIARTVDRTPEVMIKVLTRGGQNLAAVRAHLSYLSRGGVLDLETDEGERVAGMESERVLLESWDLDLEEHRRRADLRPRKDHAKPKLVHKLLFSMPPGTTPRKVLEAVQNFAREEFGLKHRYAMVLHTDEPHPHVHMVVKAVSEQGVRLHIRKATLRRWRKEFAAQLRRLGVAANATERAVRGAVGPAPSGGMYRASLRGESRVMRDIALTIGAEPLRQRQSSDSGKATLLRTREAVQEGWRGVTDLLLRDQRPDIAIRVQRFIERMPPVQTVREQFLRPLAKSREPLARDGPVR